MIPDPSESSKVSAKALGLYCFLAERSWALALNLISMIEVWLAVKKTGWRGLGVPDPGGAWLQNWTLFKAIKDY